MKPLRRPRDAWDWLTLADVERLVFAAWLDACRQMQPPAGEPFMEDGEPWVSRECFRDALTGLIAQRINAHAHASGVRRSPAVRSRDLPLPLLWDGEVLSVSDRAALASGCRGGAPTETAVRGGMADAVAVAPGRDPDAGAAPTADPLLVCPRGQDLPAPDRAGNTQAAQEAAIA